LLASVQIIDPDVTAAEIGERVGRGLR